MDTERPVIRTEEKNACPGWARLLGWLDGGLEGERAEIIGCHVPDCQDCRERLEFVQQVRRLRAVTAYRDGPLPGAESPAPGPFIGRGRDFLS